MLKLEQYDLLPPKILEILKRYPIVKWNHFLIIGLDW